jgi:surfeit locus 1 family protein
MLERSKGSMKPLILVWLFFLLFFPLMVHLGFWQLDRAEEKQTLISQQEKLQLEELRDFAIGDPVERFRRIQISGQYQDKHLLLDNRQNRGQVGYELLTLFSTIDGRALLVNRGWLAAPKYRSELPKIDLPSGASEREVLEGYFYWPDKMPTVLKNSVERGADNVWRVQELDWPAIETLFDRDIAIAREFRLLSDDIPGAKSIYWDYQMMNPAKHKGYALQWFSMSFALLVLTLFSTYKLWPRTA